VWSLIKQKTHNQGKSPYFEPSQIWWVQFGQNIATEIHGKGEQFLRPAVILTRMYTNACLVVPLTSVVKEGDYYFNFVDTFGTSQCAKLPQVRYIDGKRLKYQISSIRLEDFDALKEAFCLLIKK